MRIGAFHDAANRPFGFASWGKETQCYMAWVKLYRISC